MHHSPNPQTRFFSRAPPSSGRTKRFARISMVHPARTTRPKRCVGGKSESVTKGQGNIGIRCPPRKADWEFGETVYSTKLVNQRSCRRGCTAMLVQGSASISDKLLPQSKNRAANWRFHVAAQSPNGIGSFRR